MLNEQFFIAAAVPLATLAGFGLSLWIRDKARQAAQERLREMMKGSLAEFKSDLMVTLNGTYVRHDLLRATIAELNATMAVTMSNIIASKAVLSASKAALAASRAARAARAARALKDAAGTELSQTEDVMKNEP